MRREGSMKNVHHVGITVRDLDVSVAFYHDVLGLRFVVPPTHWFEGADLARGLGLPAPVALRIAIFEVGEGQTWLEILQYRSPVSRTVTALAQNDIGAAHVALQVDDIDRTYHELAAKGVSFVSAPNIVDEGPLAGWRWVYLRDPDGHMLEMVEIAYVHQDERTSDVEAYLAARGALPPST
jgi:catechol 2,3-dioxygenase-like lactoylglutathione lyase family enzyme